MAQIMPFVLAAAGVASCAGRANAAAVQVLGIGGTCAELVLAGAPDPEGCLGRLSYTLLDDGRTTFRFEGPRGAWLAFHGSSLAETRPGRGMTALPVDSMSQGHAAQARTLPAAGQCLYGDPFHGRSTIRCTATAEATTYRGTFVTDGQPPRREVPAPQSHAAQPHASKLQAPQPNAPRRAPP